MEETLPQSKAELKQFIVEIVNEVNENRINVVSEDEQSEIDELYGERLDCERNLEDYEFL